ncbi:hypothetical protein RKY31_10220 [Streptococcus pneumoniae]|nr:hypothetical protein [Streptococcus pneumoniae]
METPAVSAPKSEASVTVAPKSETRSETLHAPSVDTTNESGNSTESSPVTDKAPSNIGTTNQPVVSNPSSEAPAPQAEDPMVSEPKAEEPATPAPQAEEPMVSEPKAEEPAAPAPQADEPVSPAPKVEEPVTPAPKEEKPATPTLKEEKPATPAPKVEEPATPEPKADEPVTPAPKVEAPAETAEPKGTEPEVAKPATPKEEGTTAEAGTEVNPTAKEDAPEGTVSEGTTEKEKSEQASNEAGTTPGAEAKETEEKPAPKEDSTSVDESNAETSNNPTTGATTSADSGESTPSTLTSDKTKPEEVANESEGKESAESGTSATTETATPAPAADSTNEVTNEGESENPVAEETPVTEEQPSTDNTASSSATSNSADSSSSTESTAPESTTATTGNTLNSSTDVTTDGNSNDSTSNEEKPQGDEPAVEHQGSEKSLEKETEAPLETAKEENLKTINEAANSRLEEIDKVDDESKKTELKNEVNRLKEEGLKSIQNAKTNEEAAVKAEEYQEKIYAVEIPNEEVSKPNYSNEGLTNGRNDGTTIDENSSGNIGHGASTPNNSGFRSAGTYQPRVTRRPRSVSEPQNKVSIYYNFDGMKDIPGFFDDLGGKNEVDIPKGVSGEALKSILKSRIDKKKAELESRGYKISDEYFVEIDQADATHYDYVVTFTKEKAGTTGFRIAPKVQVRAKKVAKRDLSNKTKQINIYYNLTALKDIAGALGELDGENVLTFSGETSKEDLKRAVEEKTKAQIEKLKKQGFTVTSKTDLDQIIEGGDSYDYVVEFTKESKTQPVGTTGFRMAPAVQPRASRNRRSLEQPAPQKVKLNVFYNFDQMKDIAGFLGAINETSLEVAAGSTNEQVKAAVKSQVDAKKDELSKRGYTFKEDYVYQANGKDYNYVVTFSKAAK